MSDVIRLIRLSPAPPLEPGPDFLVRVGAILAAELPADNPPRGVFLCEVANVPGLHWSHNLDLRDLRPGTTITEEGDDNDT